MSREYLWGSENGLTGGSQGSFRIEGSQPSGLRKRGCRKSISS